MMLDPSGPVRYHELSFYYDSLGKMLAHAMRSNRSEDMQTILHIIDNDLISSLGDAMKEYTPPSLLGAMKTLSRARMFLRSHIFGSGPERCLYELNPEMPCQSPRLIPYQVFTPQDMLLVLDRIAGTYAADEDVLDRHGAAFLAHKLTRRNDPRVQSLKDHPTLAADPRLISLDLLSMAVRESNLRRLPGLTHWAALRVAPIFDRVHNRRLRNSIQAAFIRASKAGNLSTLSRLVFDPSFLASDERQFLEIEKWYEQLNLQIDACQDLGMQYARAVEISQRFAQTVSSLTCGGVVYWTLKTYLNW
jgi:hypothetical protein